MAAAGATSTAQGTRQASSPGAGFAAGINEPGITGCGGTLLTFLVQGKRLDRSLGSLDDTVISSQEFTVQTGYSVKHRAVGTKLPFVVDRFGTARVVNLAPSDYYDGAEGS